MFKLALHNILKHKFLFLVIGVMIALFCFYLVIGMNTLISVSRSLKTAVVENLTGDVVISSIENPYLDVMNKEGEEERVTLERWEELLTFLRGKEYVEVAAPRLRLWGAIRSDHNKKPFILTGIDPESEKGLLPGRILDEGEWLTGPNQVMMYYRHSDLLNVDLNDKLGLHVLNLQRFGNFDVAYLVGVLDYADLAYYTEFSYYAFVTLEYLNELIMSDELLAGQVFVKLKNPADAERLLKEVEEQFKGLYRFFLSEDSANLINGIHNLTYFTVFFVAFLLLLMVYITSSFLVSISIETRRQEIGIYQALGVSKWRIAMLFGGEFFIVMAAFSILGILGGLGFSNTAAAGGIEATIIPLHLIFGRSTVFIESYPETFAIIAGLLSTVFLGNTIYTALKLSKFNPVEIMREL